jgi:CheY-like chemotaxis protein
MFCSEVPYGSEADMTAEGSRNILVADDSIFFRSKLNDLLLMAGHKVQFANDGNEAVEAIKTNADRIDLLILDLQMPELDGFGVLKWVKDNGHEARFPVLVMTGTNEAANILEKLRELGASGYMSKDLSPEQIIIRINKILFP